MARDVTFEGLIIVKLDTQGCKRTYVIVTIYIPFVLWIASWAEWKWRKKLNVDQYLCNKMSSCWRKWMIFLSFAPLPEVSTVVLFMGFKCIFAVHLKRLKGNTLWYYKITLKIFDKLFHSLVWWGLWDCFG